MLNLVVELQLIGLPAQRRGKQETLKLSSSKVPKDTKNETPMDCSWASDKLTNHMDRVRNI